MGALLEDWDPAALSPPELVHLLMNLIVAGHLTVTRAIGSALVLLDGLGLLSDRARTAATNSTRSWRRRCAWRRPRRVCSGG